MATAPFRSSAGPTTYTTTTSAIGNKPSGVVNGDLLVAIIVAEAGTSVSAVPSGWTNQHTGSAFTRGMTVCWKVAASEGSSWTWTMTSSESGSVTVLAYTNPQASPYDTKGAGSGSSTAPSAASITTAQANELAVWISLYNGSTVTTTPPSGFTERIDATSSTNSAIEVCDNVYTAAGATGAQTGTGSTSTNWSAVQLGFKMLLTGNSLFFGSL